MNKAKFVIPVLLFIVIACTSPEGSGGGNAMDLVPPVLTSLVLSGPRTLELTFDEVPVADLSTGSVTPDLECSDVSIEGKKVTVTFSHDQVPGEEYALRLAVNDAAGNGLWLMASFYGFNPAPPRLLINEFTTQGSKTHPDLVELKAIRGGNLGGVAFFHGDASSHAFRFVFPPLTVADGDFILLHTKPEGIPEEIDETGGKDVSGGRDASTTAYDFWIRDGSGLSGNNGALSLYDNPHGTIMDAVIYSTRTSDSDTVYRGFGSYDFREQADAIAGAGAWAFSGEKIAPEDAVNPDDATATRSIGRSSRSEDSNGKADFHIVPTRLASFGSDNSDERFSR